MARIRNFSIIAHIDHGKSTFSDRILDLTGAIAERDRKEQALDTMDLERERGITIKAQCARIKYLADDKKEYILNLIDTPGHVDFSREVERSLSACEAAILLVDATQGIQAQTLANIDLALERDLTIIPVINKIDLAAADVEGVSRELGDALGVAPEEIIHASAKSGVGVRETLEALVARAPEPPQERDAKLRAALIDSWYDQYRGVICLVRIFEGRLKLADKIRFMIGGGSYQVDSMAVLTPAPVAIEELRAGEVGVFSGAIRQIDDAHVGDTITHQKGGATEPLEALKPIKPMVFAGIYPSDSSAYERLREALAKLRLNDSSFSFEPEKSDALGFGFRCGFLGALHMSVTQERLEREFDLDLIATTPTVVFKVNMKNGESIYIDSPAKLPDPTYRESIEEPIIEASIVLPSDRIGPIMKLLTDRRGIHLKMEYIAPTRALLRYKLPLNEVALDFHDEIKKLSSGYASVDYDMAGYMKSDLVKLDILVNSTPIDALSTIVYRPKARALGLKLTEKMKDLIPRQMFDVAIQAAIGGKIIARSNVKAIRKNVLAKCYGGDVTRKRKLLEKQKEGKKRMKTVGSVEIPQAAFLAALKTD